MHKFGLLLITLISSVSFLFGQQSDRQILKVELDTISNKLIVEHEYILINRSPKTLTHIYLNAWINAYTGRLTELNRTKLEARKGALYFSDKKDRGAVESLFIQNSENQTLKFKFEEREFVRVELNQAWKIGDTLRFKAFYELRIPFDEVTKYGRNKNGDYLLKYFFLQPAVMDKNANWNLQHYRDMEEVVSSPAQFQLNITYPENYKLYSDLDGDGNFWQGEGISFFRLYLTKNQENAHRFVNELSGLEIDFGYRLDPGDIAVTDSLLTSQIAFLEEHLGKLPSDKLFITSKTRKEQNFFGVDDLDILITEIKPFTKAERNALKLFQMLSYEYTDRMFLTDKTKDHWFKNGLQYYLMMKYTDRYFSKLKIVGHASDNFKILGMRPLNFFDGAKLKMNDRYKMLFLYIAIQSYDQPVNTKFHEFSNLNQLAVSGFKTGFTFYYIDKFLDNGDFSKLIKNFSIEHRGKQLNQLDFRNYLIENSKRDLSWFFDDYVDKKDRVNFKLLSSKSEDEGLRVKIKNSTGFKGPFQLSGIKDGQVTETQWYQDSDKKFEVIFPDGDYDQLELNRDFLFPEIIERDNYMRTRGLFKNMKKLQFRLYPDVENPKYAQVFINPQLRWNNYDKFLTGIRFQNQSLIRRPFKWVVTPRWSSGQKTLTGNALVQNTFYPQKGIFRSIRAGAGGQYEHYAKDLSYFKLSLFTISEFKKPYRSNLNQGFIISYDHLDKEIPTGMNRTEEDRYGLMNFTYYYSKPDYIHEFSSSATFQATSVFKKLFGEVYYRWRFAPKKQLGVRLFAGAFINNDSETDYFNFGLSRVSDYAFNLNLLGRSESTGVLSQQFVLSEAGFKSYFEPGVNRWLTTMNVEIPVWKMIDVYADAGVFKNSGTGTEFIYDSGIRVKLIPDFLEFYFPVQSSFGFEPAKDNYAKRIRFTFNLNFGSLINHLRRGWY